MRYSFSVFILLIMNFIYAECSDIDNQEECERVDGCEWSDNGGCYGDWEDDEGEEDEDNDWRCEDIESQVECEAVGCDWTEFDNIPGGSCSGDWEDGGGALENDESLIFSLLSNYPNPFNPVTNIDFSITDPGDVSLKVYDISGKEVSELVNGFYTPGNYSIKWDAIDSYGNQLSSGIYIYQLNTKNGILSNRMVLMR